MSVTSASGRAELDAVRAALGADYEVLEEIGRGGMAIVYRARERELDREVAVKVLPFTLAFDGDLVERFQREARTAAQLEHPSIIPIYRVGRSGQVIYFVMKLLRGESLSALLVRRGTLTVAEVRRILAEAGSALGYAARRGVVHRDVKPDNIMLDEDGRCVVTDFGIARSRSETKLTATGMTLGTPRYMSPEQARAKDVDGRSDLYSLGCVAYECLVGRPPFDGQDPVAILMDQINTPVPRPTLRSDEERALYAVIERLLAKKPADRFADGEALLAALDALGRTPSAAAAGGRPLTPTCYSPAVEAPLVEAYRERVQAMLLRTRDQADRAVARARRLGPRAWAGIIAGVAVLTGAYQGAHFATAHRSRCPAVESSATAGEGSSHALSLLVDPVASQSLDSDLDVYYDVCGLEAGTPFRTSLAVTRNGLGLKRLFGGERVEPVTASYEDDAGGPAERRHRTLDLDDLPAGGYTLEVGVVDNRGRQRERAVEFDIID